MCLVAGALSMIAAAYVGAGWARPVAEPMLENAETVG